MREFFIEMEELRFEAERIYSEKIESKKEIVLRKDFITRYAFIAITGYYDDFEGRYIGGFMDRESERVPFNSTTDILYSLYAEFNDMYEEGGCDQKSEFLLALIFACEHLITYLEAPEYSDWK